MESATVVVQMMQKHTFRERLQSLSVILYRTLLLPVSEYSAWGVERQTLASPCLDTLAQGTNVLPPFGADQEHC